MHGMLWRMVDTHCCHAHVAISLEAEDVLHDEHLFGLSFVGMVMQQESRRFRIVRVP